jgi:hypothetical protein
VFEISMAQLPCPQPYLFRISNRFCRFIYYSFDMDDRTLPTFHRKAIKNAKLTRKNPNKNINNEIYNKLSYIVDIIMPSVMPTKNIPNPKAE